MKKIFLSLLVLLAAVLTSCSDNDYMNVIPRESTLLISMNTAKLSGAGSQTLLKTILKVKNLDNTGLDLSSPLYFFEDAQGNLGLCARVDDRDKLADALSQRGITGTSRHGADFAVLPNHWVIGYSDRAALLMGPVMPAQEGEMKNLMARYLSAEEDDGVTASPLFARLDSIQAPMAMVAQAQALPQQLVAPFTLGAPKDADASQVYIAAKMKVERGRLWIDGETFSFKPSINAALKDASKIYRPIKGRYISSMSDSAAVGMFLNVDGTKFIRLMQQNRALQAMLMGINGAIDMDNIIKSIDGDMAIITPSLVSDQFQLMMSAQLKHANWLADVDYWKQSVPAGGHIGDWGKNSYYYTGDKTTYFFGVTPDLQYMSGGSKAAALQSIRPAKRQIGSDIQAAIRGQKLVMMVNIDAFSGDKAEAVTSLLKPMFGQLSTIVYTMQ
jgi:hypothetical protein